MNIENNKIIAEFMNYAIIDKNGNHKDECYNYDCNWNWLMEVVQKIEGIKIKETYGQFDENEIDAIISVSIENKFCQILSNGAFLIELFSINGETKIQAVYVACIEFIKWYNLRN